MAEPTHSLAVMGGLLAGGRSRRMGRHKAGAAWLGDSRLADAALSSLESVCEAVVVLGHGQGLDHRPDLERLPDLRPGAGPLGGLEALLASGRARRYVICPCDMPLVSALLLRTLLEQQAEAVVCRRADGRRSPLPLALDGGLLGRLQAFLQGGGRSVMGFLETLATVEVADTATSEQLLNVNTPADLERAMAKGPPLEQHMSPAKAPFPTQARAIVVGGGIVGCATAYQLAKAGWGDVLLLERGELTCGSTFHAAGLVGQLRSDASITRLLGESVALYRDIEAETGQATGWRQCGGLRLACTAERMAELTRQATTARSFGMDMHLLSPLEAQQLWPMMTIDDVVGAAFLPTDGAASPSDITRALAKGARLHGARIIENCPVTDVEVVDGSVAAVQTAQGRIQCEVIVNACGQWARAFGQMAGVEVPLIGVEHQFMITEPMDGISRDLPTLRDPDRLTYYKEEVGGLVMGGYEPNPIPWAVNGIPDGFIYKLLPSNFEHFEQLAELAMARVPALQSAGIRQLINGPESFTPDGNFILGEAPEVTNYFVAAGFNAFGIAAAGGAGWALAAWIMEGEPPYDLWPVDIRRFGLPHRDIGWVRKRTLELYGKHYTIS